MSNVHIIHPQSITLSKREIIGSKQSKQKVLHSFPGFETAKGQVDASENFATFWKKIQNTFQKVKIFTFTFLVFKQQATGQDDFIKNVNKVSRTK